MIKIEDFAQQIKRELQICKRRKLPNIDLEYEYYANFKDCYIWENGYLGIFGDGHTEQEALNEYCKKISEKEIIFGVLENHIVKIQAPKLKPK